LLITVPVMYEGLGIRGTDLSTLLLFKDFPGLEKYRKFTKLYITCIAVTITLPGGAMVKVSYSQSRRWRI